MRGPVAVPPSVSPRGDEGRAPIQTSLLSAPTTPIEPKDEAAELARQLAEVLAAADRISQRIERIQPQFTRQQQLRAAA